MIEINLPIRLQSPNVKEHWTKTHKRNKRIALAVGFTLKTNEDLAKIAENYLTSTSLWFSDLMVPKGLKIRIHLIKLGRLWDDDNMIFAFKNIRDTCASFFFPSCAPGQADGLKYFEWSYSQERGGSGIKILIEFEADFLNPIPKCLVDMMEL